MQTSSGKLAFAGSLALVLCVMPPLVDAQFGTAFPGVYSLPTNDFTWFWGEPDERDLLSRPDISTSGREGRFGCQLDAVLRPSSSLTQPVIRDIEANIGNSLYFIMATADAMYQLDLSRDLDWARLQCTITANAEPDAEQAQEKLDKAIERAERERERRRARASEDDN